MTMHSLSFCEDSERVVFLHFWKTTFAGYRILSWEVFPFCPFKDVITLSFGLHIFKWEVCYNYFFLYNELFPLTTFNIFSSFFFSSMNIICLDVFPSFLFFGIIVPRVLCASRIFVLLSVNFWKFLATVSSVPFSSSSPEILITHSDHLILSQS